MQAKPIRVLLVDNHPVVLQGLAATLEREPDIEVTAIGSNSRQAVELFRIYAPDIALVDIRLDGEETGLQAIQQIRDESPAAKIIVFSALTDQETVYRALHAGAATFLSKRASGEEVIEAVRAVHGGERPIPSEFTDKLAKQGTRPALTALELEVLKVIARPRLR